MPFNIMLHTVRKHYAVQYHAAYITQALCHSISCCIQYASIMHSIQYHASICSMQYSSIMPFNIMLHTVCKYYAIQYHAAYSMQALALCIQYSIIPSMLLHTVCKHYAVQYQAAYSTQALCCSISCCIR